MKFSDLNLHPAIAAALAARGYDTATPVQSAVLDPGHEGRDLLVSSQTGSGKTIAFGAALANTLLAPDAPAREQRVAPVALVIVPTRELAVQVREELTWVLRETGLRLASFTGGTAVSGDLRVLQRGVDLVIGTPGRLVDLVRRERLQLAHVRVVVLDEADEMLDLGFREDLEKLLQAAPATRRTLLLSATLPPEIQSLARRFQRDAVRIDPRKDGDATARQAHNDITYVAHLIAGADRLAVVVNVLRAAGTGRAIVFCTTREAVSRLHAALVARGFAATAISGDRAQAERDRALDQVRRGDARVLVATNVAARGLHLPDVDLIIHADLPLNAESLTHRSGRTGRAGRKGTAVVLASLSERRKAERLLSMAHVPAVWTAPPSAEAITAAARDRLAEELLEESAGSAEGAKVDPAAEELVQRLEASLPARDLARLLLTREFSRLPVGERIHPVAVPGPGSARGSDAGRGRFADDDDGGGRKPGRGDFSREGVLFSVNIGANEKAEPRWLLPLICRRGGVTSRDVGSIRVGANETRFEIAGAAAADFALTASERDPRAPHVTIERVGGGGAGSPGNGRSAAPRNQGRRDDRPAVRRDDRPSARPDFRADAARAPRAPHAAAPKAPHAAAAPKEPHTTAAPKAPHAAAAPKEPHATAAPKAPPAAAAPKAPHAAAAPKASHSAVAAKTPQAADKTPQAAELIAPPATPAPAQAARAPAVNGDSKPHTKRPAPAAPIIETKRAPLLGKSARTEKTERSEKSDGKLTPALPASQRPVHQGGWGVPTSTGAAPLAARAPGGFDPAPTDRPRAARPSPDRPRADRAPTDRPRADRPPSDRPFRPAAHGAAGGKRPFGTRPPSFNRDGDRPPRPNTGTGAAGAKRPHSPSTPAYRDRPHRGVAASGGDSPPRRTDGMNPVKRSFGKPPAASAGDGPSGPSPRPPFWKEGARRRPTGPATRPDAAGSRPRPGNRDR